MARLGAYARHKARTETMAAAEQRDRETLWDEVDAHFDRAEEALMRDDLRGARDGLAKGFHVLLFNLPDKEHMRSERERGLNRRRIGLAVSCIWLGHELKRIQEEEQAHA